jgi:hypothetical protein
MNPTRNHKLLAAAAAVVALVLLAGCSIETKESKDDKGNKNVKIETPWGGLSVRTDPEVKETGLPLYPGAQRKPGDEHDKHAANVDITTPMFGLKVVAMEFVTNDPPEKVLSFYRDKMKSFGGKFLECQNSGYVSIDENGKFAEEDNEKELTCGKRHGGAVELKVGTPGDQHVVAIKSSGKGSEFALVFVQKHGARGTV